MCQVVKNRHGKPGITEIKKLRDRKTYMYILQEITERNLFFIFLTSDTYSGFTETVLLYF